MSLTDRDEESRLLADEALVRYDMSWPPPGSTFGPDGRLWDYPSNPPVDWAATREAVDAATRVIS